MSSHQPPTTTTNNNERARTMGTIEVLARSTDAHGQMDRATAYLYRGWEVDRGSLRPETPGDDAYLLFDIVPDGSVSSLDAAYQAGRLASGSFGVKVVAS